MSPRAKKIVVPPTLKFIPAAPGIDRWLVLGLDPSLSRTGYALLQVDLVSGSVSGVWIKVGSLAPDDAGQTVWARSKAISLALRSILKEHEPTDGMATGLIISLEAPTPRNDFLASISRILQVQLFDDGVIAQVFKRTFVQFTNASTLRSLMGLTQTGSKNKKENVAKAYTFLDATRYPNLDTDACDAVLMAMMGRHAAALLFDKPDALPSRVLTTMCDASEEVKGKGRNARLRTRGTLHRREYWAEYVKKLYTILHRDARAKARSKPARIDLTF
jgi:Holliday junction resolvasome RuvABC endonuclease subunit